MHLVRVLLALWLNNHFNFLENLNFTINSVSNAGGNPRKAPHSSEVKPFGTTQ